MKFEQVKNYVIKPALNALGLYTKDREELLLGTCCVESRCGQYLQQINGPALGIFQMEMPTHDDIYCNFLKYQPELKNKIAKLYCPGLSPEDNLRCNLVYAAAMAALHYFRFAEPIPSTLTGRAEYWKKYYNTKKGKGSIDDYLEAFESCR